MTSRASCLLVFCFSVGSLAFAQNQSTSSQGQSFRVSASQTWTDTGVDLGAGDTVSLSTEPTSGSPSGCAPDGAPSGSSGNLPLASAPAGALIARISDKSEPLLVGSNRELHTDSGGRLYLGVNQTRPANCVFEVTAKLTHGQ